MPEINRDKTGGTHILAWWACIARWIRFSAQVYQSPLNANRAVADGRLLLWSVECGRASYMLRCLPLQPRPQELDSMFVTLNR